MTKVELIPPGRAGSGHLRQVLDLLEEVDDEFLPPLSARTDTLSVVPPPPREGSRSARESGLATYLTAMREESWLLACAGERVVGVLSYRAGHAEPALRHCSPSHYVTTIAVARRCRSSGVATALYDALDDEARSTATRWVSTRTWSTNAEHVRLLRARGFAEVARHPRAIGVDSVYFVRAVRARASVLSP